MKIMIAENVRTCRKKKGLTQHELADALGYNEVTIGSWERGDRMPSVDSVILLAQFFDVSIDDFMLHDLGSDK